MVVAVVLVAPVVTVVPVVPVVPAIPVVKNFLTAEDNFVVDEDEDEEPASKDTVDERVSVIGEASSVAVASLVSVSRAIVVGDDVYGAISLARNLSQLRSSSSIKE